MNIDMKTTLTIATLLESGVSKEEIIARFKNVTTDKENFPPKVGRLVVLDSDLYKDLEQFASKDNQQIYAPGKGFAPSVQNYAGTIMKMPEFGKGNEAKNENSIDFLAEKAKKDREELEKYKDELEEKKSVLIDMEKSREDQFKKPLANETDLFELIDMGADLEDEGLSLGRAA